MTYAGEKQVAAEVPARPRSVGVAPVFRGPWAPWIYALLLFAINAGIVFHLFRIEFTAPLHSLEGSFIAISRIMVEQPDEHFWWPLWNAGLPFEHIYLPLLQVIVASITKMTGWPVGLAYHAVTATLYSLGPVALFWLAWILSRRPGASFAAALFYSLVSPSAMLFPAILEDLGGLWDARRLQVLVYYGAGPQVSSLTFLPLAIGALHLALERRRPILFVAAGVMMAATVLTNAFGAVTLAMAVACLLVARAPGSFRRDLGLTLSISAIAYLWISPWLPLSMLQSISANSPTSGGDFRWQISYSLAVAGVLAGCGLLWFAGRKWRLPTHLRFFSLFGFLLTIIPALDYGAGIYVLPQPTRYHLEMELALCGVVVFILLPWTDRLGRNAKVALLATVVVFGVWQWSNYRGYARQLIQPADTQNTIEYEMAQRMTEIFGPRRVMATGSCAYWMNVFSNTPQLSGGHDPTALNWMQRVAVYVVYAGTNDSRDGEISALWLKAFGVHGVNVSGPGSREPYKPIANPQKFEGLLPVVWREGPDTIYRVPQRSDSLVYVIPREAMVAAPPANGVDTSGIEAYVAALEDPSLPVPVVTWRRSHSAFIQGSVGRGQIVSVQVNHTPGWKALVRGSPQPIFPDGLGLMAIDPECDGPCEIELFHDGGIEHSATRLISLSVMIGVALWCAAGLFKRRRV